MKDAKTLSDLVQRYRVGEPKKFRLTAIDPHDDGGFSKDEGKALLKQNLERLSDLQEMLYAQGQWAVLIVLQAMDAAGKDSLIEHVMTAFNPQGCVVHPFKAPNNEELAHDFLWRAHRRLPGRGQIAVFNRSYYEEVVVVRVHPKFLIPQKLPGGVKEPELFQQRFKDIVAFEDYLARSGTKILKFHLRLSPDEQRQRFLDRLNEPGKLWKFSMADVEERKLWDDYMSAYEDMIQNTSHPSAPWHVVPADRKWFSRLIVSAALVEAFESLALAFPEVPKEALPDIDKAREVLTAQKADGDGPDGKPARAARKRKQS